MRVRTLCTVALVTALPLAAGLPAHAAPRKPPPKPGALWQQYPLGTQTLTGTTPTRTHTTAPKPAHTPRRAPRGSAVPRSSSSRVGLWPFALAAAVLLLGGIALAIARRWSRRQRRSTRVAVTELHAAIDAATRPPAPTPEEIAIEDALDVLRAAKDRLDDRRRARGIEDRRRVVG